MNWEMTTIISLEWDDTSAEAQFENCCIEQVSEYFWCSKQPFYYFSIINVEIE